MGSIAQERRKLMRSMFSELYQYVDQELSVTRRTMLARILYAYGFSPSSACNENVHTACSVSERCACDCHLTDEQYLAIHGTRKPLNYE